MREYITLPVPVEKSKLKSSRAMRFWRSSDLELCSQCAVCRPNVGCSTFTVVVDAPVVNADMSTLPADKADDRCALLCLWLRLVWFCCACA